MKKVLFVCLGNICRSPAAEGIMQSLVKAKDLETQIYCDSAGTSGYHNGEPADARMRQHATKRSYILGSRSRQFVTQDFIEFDYIITMDESNYEEVCALDPQEQYKHKVHPMVKFCQEPNVPHVPDPYYGGAQGFERVLDILEDHCQGLLKHIQNDHSQ